MSIFLSSGINDKLGIESAVNQKANVMIYRKGTFSCFATSVFSYLWHFNNRKNVIDVEHKYLNYVDDLHWHLLEKKHLPNK